jgi:sec-independent protein translocase protein TatA
MFGLSPAKLLLIALILLLIFGASRLADIGKGLGEGIRNFKKGIRGDDPEGKPLKPKRKKTDD